MVGWQHRFNGHEFEQTLGDREGQGSLACCSPWGRKESHMTERLNNKTTADKVCHQLQIKINCHQFQNQNQNNCFFLG